MTTPASPNYELTLSNLKIELTRRLQELSDAIDVKISLAKEIDNERVHHSHDSGRLLGYMKAAAIVDSMQFKVDVVKADIEQYSRFALKPGTKVLYTSPLSPTLAPKDPLNKKVGRVVKDTNEDGNKLKLYQVEFDGREWLVNPICLSPTE